MARAMSSVLAKKRLRKSETARPERANRRPSNNRQAKRHAKSVVQENPN